MMNLKPTTIKTRKRQAGLTLLELTVVMLILIGLAGLALPYASGFLQRAHDSTGASNLQAINQAIDRVVLPYRLRGGIRHIPRLGGCTRPGQRRYQ